ncbi:hypothetical protein [Streptomyces sp. NBC_00096]|uniref:hypothetical protein n=1 Tax=Streptomyces sp. NBC_00096 TaxID=2975650 RepID=UPI0032452BE1
MSGTNGMSGTGGQPPKSGPVGQMGEEAIVDHSGSRRPGTVRPSSAQRVSIAL